MSALTYDLRKAAADVNAQAAQTKPAKGFWTRIFDAMIEARMRQAERKVRQHLHLIPKDLLAESGLEARLSASSALPFVK